MDGKGKDALLRTSRTSEWTIDNGGYLSLLFGGFIIFGCLLAYIIAVARGNVDPFLPLISDAAGSPPQNGLFGTVVSIGGMIGVLFMLLRYLVVIEKNQGRSKMILFLNKLSLIVGIISMFGITLVTGYPINFYRNRDVWLMDVGIPHMIGGVMLFSFGIVYQSIQCILTLFLKPKEGSVLLTRFAICFICTGTFVYHLVTVPESFVGFTNECSNSTESETFSDPFPSTLGAHLKLPIDTGGSYVYSAVTEWVLVLFFCFFFFTFFHETQEYSLLVVIETQCPEIEPSKEAATNGARKASVMDPLQPLSIAGLNERRVSEVKTVFRRDSTCQTQDGPERILMPSAKVLSEMNGKYTKRPSTTMELLSGNNLEKLIEDTMKSKVKNNTAVETKDTGVQ